MKVIETNIPGVLILEPVIFGDSRGFAHGFAVLSETAVFSYTCDQYYAPEHEGGIYFNDPELNIGWLIPESKLILSGKDKNLPLLNEIEAFHYCQITAFSG